MIMMFLEIFLGILLVFILIGSILHSTYFKSKFDQIKPYGKLIQVFDGKMHITQMGNGNKTIVLLPGLGTALPSTDFAPLMRKLSKDYKVVCIEYFGVGFSSNTKSQRTCKNYVEEIRTALSSAGFNAPYVLMPHSISSIYSEYYASVYPKEVEAIISLDGTSTSYIGKEMPAFIKPLLRVAKVQQAMGFTSILAQITTNKNKLRSYGYTGKEISHMITFAGFSLNNNILEQIANSTQYVKAVNALPYPKDDVPYFKIISKHTYETKNSQIKISPKEYQTVHLERVGAEKSYEILDGTHYIYLNNVEKISEITRIFLHERIHI